MKVSLPLLLSYGVAVLASSSSKTSNTNSITAKSSSSTHSSSYGPSSSSSRSTSSSKSPSPSNTGSPYGDGGGNNNIPTASTCVPGCTQTFVNGTACNATCSCILPCFSSTIGGSPPTTGLVTSSLTNCANLYCALLSKGNAQNTTSCQTFITKLGKSEGDASSSLSTGTTKQTSSSTSGTHESSKSSSFSSSKYSSATMLPPPLSTSETTKSTSSSSNKHSSSYLPTQTGYSSSGYPSPTGSPSNYTNSTNSGSGIPSMSDCLTGCPQYFLNATACSQACTCIVGTCFNSSLTTSALQNNCLKSCAAANCRFLTNGNSDNTTMCMAFIPQIGQPSSNNNGGNSGGGSSGYGGSSSSIGYPNPTGTNSGFTPSTTPTPYTRDICLSQCKGYWQNAAACATGCSYIVGTCLNGTVTPYSSQVSCLTNYGNTFCKTLAYGDAHNTTICIQYISTIGQPSQTGSISISSSIGYQTPTGTFSASPSPTGMDASSFINGCAGGCLSDFPGQNSTCTIACTSILGCISTPANQTSCLASIGTKYCTILSNGNASMISQCMSIVSNFGGKPSGNGGSPTATSYPSPTGSPSNYTNSTNSGSGIPSMSDCLTGCPQYFLNATACSQACTCIVGTCFNSSLTTSALQNNCLKSCAAANCRFLTNGNSDNTTMCMAFIPQIGQPSSNNNGGNSGGGSTGYGGSSSSSVYPSPTGTSKSSAPTPTASVACITSCNTAFASSNYCTDACACASNCQLKTNVQDCLTSTCSGFCNSLTSSIQPLNSANLSPKNLQNVCHALLGMTS